MNYINNFNIRRTIIFVIIIFFSDFVLSANRLAKIDFEGNLSDINNFANVQVYPSGIPGNIVNYVPGQNGLAVRSSHNNDDGGGDLEIGIPTFPATNELYIKYWVRYDINYEIESGTTFYNTKHLWLDGGNSTGHTELLIAGIDKVNNIITFLWQGGGITGFNNGTVLSKYVSTSHRIGDWMKMEIFIKLSTGVNHANNDGNFKLTVNDNILLNETNVVTGYYAAGGSDRCPALKATADCPVNKGWWELDNYEIWDGLPDIISPSAPSDLLIHSFSSSQINITWTASTDNGGVTGYRIYRNSSNTPIATVNSSLTSFTDANLTHSTVYTYKVSAIDAGGNESGFSNEVAVTTKDLLAFPGAEGFGAYSKGGKFGQIIKVTNLNDNGPGSLREAVTKAGPRIVVFDVSGNINLTSSVLTVNNPYLTIAGQTSPGGVAVSGKQFNVATHDVIIRHMRFRSGGHQYTGDDSDGDSFDIWGQNWGGNPVYNIILDHCSFTWGTDETLSVTGGATKTTIQRCLIAEGLNYAKSSSSRHSKGLMVSGKYNYDTEVSLYRNYIAHVDDRAPLLYNPPAEDHDNVPIFIVEGTNNVSYNWQSGNRPGNGGDAPVNWTDNYAKEGPNSNRQNFFFEYANRLTTPKPLIYVKGNIGTGRLLSDPEWLVSEDWHAVLLSNAWQKSTPWVVSKSLPSQTMSYSLAQEIVLESGANIPIRDSVDTRIVNSFAAGTGSIPARVTYPDDWPIYSAPAPLSDTDQDAMPDSWESTQGLNSQVDDSALDKDNDGYTNIEEYLHYLSKDDVSISNEDINSDGNVDIIDVQICVNHILNVSANQNADVNKDGFVDTKDVLMIISEIVNS